jgi:hypothetical protein
MDAIRMKIVPGVHPLKLQSSKGDGGTILYSQENSKVRIIMMMFNMKINIK